MGWPFREFSDLLLVSREHECECECLGPPMKCENEAVDVPFLPRHVQAECTGGAGVGGPGVSPFLAQAEELLKEFAVDEGEDEEPL